MKTNRSQIMKSAWKLARNGAAKFGGNVKEYLACALMIIWSQTRLKPVAVWKAGIGNVYLLPGIPVPHAPVKNGQLGLPGFDY